MEILYPFTSAWFGLFCGLMVLSKSLTWLYSLGYYRRVRAGIWTATRPTPSWASALILHPAPWLLLLSAAVVGWLLSRTRTQIETGFLWGLLASLPACGIFAVVTYRRMKANPPARPPEPRNPMWPWR